MKKLLLIFSAIILTTLACKKENPEPIVEEETTVGTEPSNETEVIIHLPSNSSFSAQDLTVSSIFTNNAPVTDSTSAVQTFDGNSFELIIANNQYGNPTLMSYYNPATDDFAELSVESTAIALTLFHPWTFDLSIDAKIEAIDYIKSLPQYNTLISELENSLANGNQTPLEVTQMHDAIIALQTNTFGKYSLDIEPLKLETSGSMVGIVNVTSSNSYAWSVYDQNGNIVDTTKLVPHLQKLNLTWQGFKDWIFNTETNTHVPELVSLPSDGNYMIKVKSGLSFDSSQENLTAAWDNTKILAGNIIGLFSDNLKQQFKLSTCLISVGKYIYNNSAGPLSISESINDYFNNNIDGFQLTLHVIDFMKTQYQDVVNIIKNCNQNANINPLSFKDYLEAMVKITTKVESAFNSTNHLTEWLINQKEFNICLQKTGNSVGECSALAWGAGTPYPKLCSSNCLPSPCDRIITCNSYSWGGAPPYQITVIDETNGTTHPLPNGSQPFTVDMPAVCVDNTYTVYVIDNQGDSIGHTFVCY